MLIWTGLRLVDSLNAQFSTLSVDGGFGKMQEIKKAMKMEVSFHPAGFPEREIQGRKISRPELGDIYPHFPLDNTVEASDEDARNWVHEVDVSPPDEIVSRELSEYAEQHGVALGVSEQARKDMNFHLIEVPLSVSAPLDKHIVLLRLELSLEPTSGENPPVFFSLYPTPMSQETVYNTEDANIDLSSTLAEFVSFHAGDKAVGSLGLRLGFPLQWKSRRAEVLSSAPLKNTIEWCVTDHSIRNGFIAYAIVRMPRGTKATLTPSLGFELRKSYFWKYYEMDKPPHTYTIGQATA